MLLLALQMDMHDIAQHLFNYVQQSTHALDSSHDLNHTLKLTKNMLEIIEVEYPTYDSNLPYERNFTIEIAMLRDVCDHKYSESITKDELKKFINTCHVLSFMLLTMSVALKK
jgi:hypothetical protein